MKEYELQVGIPDENNNEQIESQQNQEFEKPEYVKTIESFDIQNLSPEQITFMKETIRDYFKENFPVSPEIADQIPDKIELMNTANYREYLKTAYGENIDEELLSNSTGSYNLDLDKIIITIDDKNDATELFEQMFHESLHLVSKKQGGGFGGEFKAISRGEEYEENFMIGGITLIEGTTQLITMDCVYGDMGFDEHEDSNYVYLKEKDIVSAIAYPFANIFYSDIYFNTPNENIRIYIEQLFADDANADIANNSTNLFADCIATIGQVSKAAQEASWKDDGWEEYQNLLKDVKHSIGFLLIKMSEKRGYPPTKEEKQLFGEYLEHYL